MPLKSINLSIDCIYGWQSKFDYFFFPQTTSGALASIPAGNIYRLTCIEIRALKQYSFYLTLKPHTLRNVSLLFIKVITFQLLYDSLDIYLFRIHAVGDSRVAGQSHYPPTPLSHTVDKSVHK